MEFVGPHDDMKLGLHQVARYYHYPRWQEATSVTFNRKAHEALPTDFKRALDAAALIVPADSVVSISTGASEVRYDSPGGSCAAEGAVPRHAIIE